MERSSSGIPAPTVGSTVYSGQVEPGRDATAPLALQFAWVLVGASRTMIQRMRAQYVGFSRRMARLIIAAIPEMGLDAGAFDSLQSLIDSRQTCPLCIRQAQEKFLGIRTFRFITRVLDITGLDRQAAEARQHSRHLLVIVAEELLPRRGQGHGGPDPIVGQVEQVVELTSREVAQADEVLRSGRGGHGMRLPPGGPDSTPRGPHRPN